MKEIEIKRDIKLSKFICFVMITMIAINLRNVFLNNGLLYNIFHYINIFIRVLYVFNFLYIIPIILRRMKSINLIFTLCIAIFSIINIAFFPETNHFFFQTFFSFISTCFPCFIVISTINNFDVLKDYLIKYSRIICGFIVLLLIIQLFIISNNNHTEYLMGLGYSLSLPVIILILLTIKRVNYIDTILIIITILYIVLFASRGPLISIIIAFVYTPIKNAIDDRKKIKLFFIITLLLLSIIFYKELIIAMVDCLQHVGFNSRTLEVISSDLFHDSGRTEIYNLLISKITENPFTIRGINSEYLLTGGYAHNIFIELLYQFGIIIGFPICLYIMIKSIKTLLSAKSNKDLLSLTFFLGSIPCLLVSSSIWINYSFWIWVALILKKNEYNIV